MASVQPKSKAEVKRLPCRAHAVGYGESGRAVVPGKPQAGLTPETHDGKQPETYQADRAFHAMLARLTGGISPVALSLAYIDWASHLASAPQREMEVARDAAQNGQQLFETALQYFSSGKGPWSLIKPQPQD